MNQLESKAMAEENAEDLLIHVVEPPRGRNRVDQVQVEMQDLHAKNSTPQKKNRQFKSPLSKMARRGKKTDPSRERSSLLNDDDDVDEEETGSENSNSASILNDERAAQSSNADLETEDIEVLQKDLEETMQRIRNPMNLTDEEAEELQRRNNLLRINTIRESEQVLEWGMTTGLQRLLHAEQVQRWHEKEDEKRVHVRGVARRILAVNIPVAVLFMALVLGARTVPSVPLCTIVGGCGQAYRPRPLSSRI